MQPVVGTENDVMDAQLEPAVMLNQGSAAVVTGHARRQTKSNHPAGAIAATKSHPPLPVRSPRTELDWEAQIRCSPCRFKSVRAPCARPRPMCIMRMPASKVVSWARGQYLRWVPQPPRPQRRRSPSPQLASFALHCATASCKAPYFPSLQIRGTSYKITRGCIRHKAVRLVQASVCFRQRITSDRCPTYCLLHQQNTPKTHNEYGRRSRGGRPRRVLERPAHRPQCTHRAPYQVIAQRG